MLSHDKDQCKTDMGERYTSSKQLFICFVDENQLFFQQTIAKKMCDFIDNRCRKKVTTQPIISSF